MRWHRCLESFPDRLFKDLEEFDPDYDEGKVALQNQVHLLNLRIKTVVLENDTLKDIMERKNHLLKSPRDKHRSKYFF